MCRLRFCVCLLFMCLPCIAVACRAIAALIAHYQPDAVPKAGIQQRTALALLQRVQARGSAGTSSSKAPAARGSRMPSKVRGRIDVATAAATHGVTSRMLRPGVTVEGLGACLSAERGNWALVQSALRLLDVPLAAGLGEWGVLPLWRQPLHTTGLHQPV